MCHTDLQVLEGVYKEAGSFEGMIGSHEPAGVVVKLGSKAESEGVVKVGDRVGSINVSWAFVFSPPAVTLLHV
jgi:propanol-preferring alcohol dehydrogenase